MDYLSEAALSYNELINKEFIVTFSNNESIHFSFKKGNFFHLAGLNKLNDLQLFSGKISPTSIYKMILDGRVTSKYLTSSRFFGSDSRDRISCISRITELLCCEGSAVYGFDKRICRAHVCFRSKIIFFKEDSYDFFITLGLAEERDNNLFYPETLFYRYDRAYIDGQNIVRIKNITATPHAAV